MDRIVLMKNAASADDVHIKYFHRRLSPQPPACLRSWTQLNFAGRPQVRRQHMRTRLNSAVTCNDLLPFEMWSNMASESTSADIEGSVLQVLECVVNYVDPTTSSNAMNAFVGGKRACAYSFIGNALLLASVCKARGRTCRPQGGSSKTRPRVQHRYKR